MVITVTSLRLKSLFRYFPLTYLAMWVTLQVYKSKGFIKFKNTGFGHDHYTLTAWETEADMKDFSNKGSHLGAMKHAMRIAEEIRVLTYQSDKIPEWQEVKKLLAEKPQKIIKF